MLFFLDPLAFFMKYALTMNLPQKDHLWRLKMSNLLNFPFFTSLSQSSDFGRGIKLEKATSSKGICSFHIEPGPFVRMQTRLLPMEITIIHHKLSINFFLLTHACFMIKGGNTHLIPRYKTDAIKAVYPTLFPFTKAFSSEHIFQSMFEYCCSFI